MYFIYKGKSYKNLKEACKSYNLDYRSVWHKLRSGKTLEEAFTKNNREFIYNDITYRSLKAAAEKNGLDYRTVWSRLKLGKTITEAFYQKNLPRTGRSSPITVNGKTYSAVSVAARFFGVSEKTIHGRLERGLTPEQAVGLVSFDIGNEKSIKVNKKVFTSIASAARYFDIPLYTVYNRLKRGRSLKDVFHKGEIKRKSPRFKVIKVFGLEFETLKDACDYFAISYQVARYRLRKKWSLDQIFELKPGPINKSKNAPKTFEFNGKFFNSASSLAKEHGVVASNLHRRLTEGWSLEESLELIDREYEGKPLKIDIDGQMFASRNDAARHFGINIGTVSTRVNKQGWSIKQALELLPPPAGFHTDFGAIYLITNKVNSMKYVGITLQNPPIKRFENHIKSSENKKERKVGSIAEAIFNLGFNKFSFKVIETAKTQTELQELEKYHINRLNTLTPNGFNLSKGGTIGRVPGRPLEIPSLKLNFKTIADAARHFNMAASALIYRLNNGYSPEQAVGLEPFTYIYPKSVNIRIDGLKFNTIKDAAHHFKHPPNRIRNRIHSGWSLEKALKTPFISRSKPLKIKGVYYSSLRNAAEKLGLSKDTVRWRIRNKKF